MANLIGYINSDRSEVHRISSKFIRSRLETWDGCIEVTMNQHGQFEVFIGPKGSPDYNKPIQQGNVNTGERLSL